MLDRVIVAMKADSAGTLAKINEGAEGFRDRDLYPFCSGPDGQELQGPATDDVDSWLAIRSICQTILKVIGCAFGISGVQHHFASGILILSSASGNSQDGVFAVRERSCDGDLSLLQG